MEPTSTTPPITPAATPLAHDDHDGRADKGSGTPPDAAVKLASSEHAQEHDAAANRPPASKTKTYVRFGVVVVVCALAGWYLVPWVILSLNTVSTDDAYIDGHVTFVAPRVAGQVARVLVDDNYRVKKGDLLVAIDPEPFRVEVEIKKSLVQVAETDLAAAHAQVEAYVGQVRAARFNLEHAIENVRNSIALLRSNVAQLKVEQAGLTLAQRDYERNKPLLEKTAISQADFDVYAAKRDQAVSRVESAEQVVQETRALLGLPMDLVNPLDVPPNLDQNFSLVRQSLGNLMQSAAQIGYTPKSWNATPQQMIDEFYKLDRDGNIDTIYAKLIPNAPLIKQAEAKLLQMQRDLDLAELDLSYCNIVSEIDGVVTRRNVNPGNFIQTGQSLMAVRSLTEIWVNANFKETQLAELRIGQRVSLDIDMYGGNQNFEGRITGFAMGTGQTLALLPPQNATGNFIKIVQRLPVRVEFTNYDADRTPLFVGLSVVPRVYIKEQATGSNAGAVLQPNTLLPRPSGSTPAPANNSKNNTSTSTTAPPQVGTALPSGTSAP